MPNPMKLAMGLAWETYLETLFERQGLLVERPPEQMSKEGVAFSPDMFIIDEGQRPRVGETKLTWMSNLDDLTHPKFSKWLVQVQYYCEEMSIPLASFFVNYVNGNYRNRRDPELVRYDVEFSARELRENKQMLMNLARQEKML